MSLKRGSIKPGELRSLDRAGLVFFASRYAVRVEPWWPDRTATHQKAGKVMLDYFVEHLK